MNKMNNRRSYERIKGNVWTWRDGFWFC